MNLSPRGKPLALASLAAASALFLLAAPEPVRALTPATATAANADTDAERNKTPEPGGIGLTRESTDLLNGKPAPSYATTPVAPVNKKPRRVAEAAPKTAEAAPARKTAARQRARQNRRPMRTVVVKGHPTRSPAVAGHAPHRRRNVVVRFLAWWRSGVEKMFQYRYSYTRTRGTGV